jgi:hypothetical protein
VVSPQKLFSFFSLVSVCVETIRPALSIRWWPYPWRLRAPTGPSLLSGEILLVAYRCEIGIAGVAIYWFLSPIEGCGLLEMNTPEKHKRF